MRYRKIEIMVTFEEYKRFQEERKDDLLKKKVSRRFKGWGIDPKGNIEVCLSDSRDYRIITQYRPIYSLAQRWERLKYYLTPSPHPLEKHMHRLYGYKHYTDHWREYKLNKRRIG